jgi:hypothetical protein
VHLYRVRAKLAVQAAIYAGDQIAAAFDKHWVTKLARYSQRRRR